MSDKIQNVSYQIVDGNIHYFTLHTAKRQTIEDLFTLLTDITQKNGGDKTLLYLFDSSPITELPYRYLLQRAEQWRKEMTILPPSRNAVLYNRNTLMLHVVNMVVEIFNKKEAKSRLFSANGRQEAIQWLKQDED